MLPYYNYVCLYSSYLHCWVVQYASTIDSEIEEAQFHGPNSKKRASTYAKSMKV